MTSNIYPRDFRGYSGKPPNPKWPEGARIAISVVINIEAGAELSLADGDESNESVYEIIEKVENVPNFCLNSHFDYGPRVGYWRLMRILESYDIPCTLSCAGRAIERSPWIASDAHARGHEIAAHGYRWESHAGMDESHERQVITNTVSIIEEACGVRPLGWHTKGAPSPNTRRLLVEEGFLYDSDAYDDDLPHIQKIAGKEHVVMPYAFDTNDMRFMAGGNFVLAEDFATYCIDAFNTLWEEGEECPAMMSIGIHPRLIGRPGRIRGLIQFLDHASDEEEVWFARRIDIAEHFRSLNSTIGSRT
ncbi:MAG: polysaccharide deacetylase family protein [Chlamydiales bacterium]|nr:polysaccharide deacetylase family protein [Chlamydiales bacterium]